MAAVLLITSQQSDGRQDFYWPHGRHKSAFETAAFLMRRQAFLRFERQDFAEWIVRIERLQIAVGMTKQRLIAKLRIAASRRLRLNLLQKIAMQTESMAAQIENAGAVFIGPWSSEPVGDYFAGPNHVLPTNGTGRFFSPLGVYDFLKRMSIIRYSEKAIKKNAKAIAAVATEEGFIHHAAAVLKRL